MTVGCNAGKPLSPTGGLGDPPFLCFAEQNESVARLQRITRRAWPPHSRISTRMIVITPALRSLGMLRPMQHRRIRPGTPFLQRFEPSNWPTHQDWMCSSLLPPSTRIAGLLRGLHLDHDIRLEAVSRFSRVPALIRYHPATVLGDE